MFQVRVDLEQALELLEHRGIPIIENNKYEISELVRRILVDEKEYPDYTKVEINGDNNMDMALVVYSDGSWELV